MTDSLFNGNDPADNTPDPAKNYLEELVGEDKKFKTPEDLARGKAEADAFIERLKREQEELRKELNTRLTLEQYLDRIGTKQDPSRNDSTPNEPNGGGVGNETQTSLKAEDIEQLIERKVSERERQRIQEQNVMQVKQELQRAFGSDFTSKLRETGQALGMTEEEMNSLAASRPKAFLKLVGADQAPAASASNNSLFTPPSSSLNTASAAKPTGDRTQSYYDAIKQKDPKAYWSPAVQNQLHQDAIRLGERFFDK